MGCRLREWRGSAPLGGRAHTFRSRGAKRASGSCRPPRHWARRPATPRRPASPRWLSFATGTRQATGREEFGERFVDRFVLLGRLAGLSDADLVATATAFTARTIADAQKFLPRRVEEVFISGGGARNPTLMRRLQETWGGLPVRTVEALGWDGRALEAVAFAVFAYQHVRGVPCNLPQVTGAKRAVVLGAVTPGK